jgi:hypothetical protein
MSSSRATVKCGRVVGRGQAQQLWNWVLRRQGLSDESRLESVLSVTEASLGLHAARLPSPFATVVARCASPNVALSLFAAKTRTEVMTVRCMRKTLHTLPVGLASSAHAATAHFRERDALRAIHNAGMETRAVLRVIDEILRLLKHGPLFHRSIENHLVSQRRPTMLIRLAIKLAWERGALTYLNETTGWNREHRTFGLSHLLYPRFNRSLDPQSAVCGLVDAYFDRYGPASLRDVMWWSGLSRSAVTRAMAESGREWVELQTGWADSVVYMYRDRFEEFLATSSEQGETGLNLLAHEDVALKAYFETRRRYLGDLPATAAFNQIGEVLPTIVLNGRVIGTWAWDPYERGVSCSMVSDRHDNEVRLALKQRAAAMAHSLRLGWTDHTQLDHREGRARPRIPSTAVGPF